LWSWENGEKWSMNISRIVEDKAVDVKEAKKSQRLLN
jgi:hypothetical protein